MPDSVTNLQANAGTAWHVQGNEIMQQLGYISGSGSPVGSVTPSYIGQLYYDTAGTTFYIADTTSNTGWSAFAIPSETSAALGYLIGLTAGVASASKAIVVDANKNVTGLGILDTIVGAGSTKTLAIGANNQTIEFNTATGSVVTLPAATGSGAKYKFVVSVLATSNSHILYTASANGVGGSDIYVGIIPGVRVDTGNAVTAFAAASNSNTITLNRTTTGSVSLGEWLEVEDIATNTWAVRGFLSSTGAAFATPFSHT